VSGSDDFTLFLWHRKEMKHPIKRLTGHQWKSITLERQERRFHYNADWHVGAVYQVAWSSDSRYLVSASKDSTGKLWEIPSGKRARETLLGHADEVYALDWSPNGASIATGSKDRTSKNIQALARPSN
jgi:ribosome assembly protein 4